MRSWPLRSTDSLPYLNRLRWADAIWLPTAPLFLWANVFEHESMHVLVGWWRGSTVEKFVAWPTTELGTFTWGYVRLDPPVSESVWLMSAAPFLADAVLAAVGVGLATLSWRRGHRALWLGTVLLFIVGAISNSVWGWWFSSARGNSDVDKLLRVLPDWIVHGWFLVTIPAYVAALVWTLREGPRPAYVTPLDIPQPS